MSGGPYLGVLLRKFMFWLRQQRTNARAGDLNRHSACVACGSAETVVVPGPEGEQRACEACGYVGRADGGGELSAHELGSLHEDDGGPFGWGK